MAGSYSMHGRDMRIRFCPEKLKITDDSEGLSVDEKITLEWILEK
jgi:hypothetical protein